MVLRKRRKPHRISQNGKLPIWENHDFDEHSERSSTMTNGGGKGHDEKPKDEQKKETTPKQEKK